MSQSNPSAMRSVKSPPPASLWERLRSFVARLQSAAPPPPPLLRNPEAMLSALSSPSPRVRWEAAAALARAAPSSRLIVVLVGALDDPHPFVRLEASKALAALDPELTRPPLVAALQSPSPRQAAAAAETLGRIGDEQAVAALTRALHQGEVAVRLSVLEALAAVGGLPTITALLAALDDPEPAVRLVAATLLGQLRPESAVRPLAERLAAYVCTPADECVVPTALRRQLAWALGRMVSGGEAVQSALVRALDDVDAGVRYWAAQGLARLGDERALPPLRAHLSDESNAGTGRVAEAAAKAIAAIQARTRRKASVSGQTKEEGTPNKPQ